MSHSDVDLVKGVLQRYIEGTRSGNLPLVQSAFHPDARMSGYMQGELLVGSPQPFYDAVANAPSPEKSGEPYQTQVSDLVVTGSAAAATLVEGSYLGMHFTNYFHFLKVGSEWLIVSKTFHHT